MIKKINSIESVAKFVNLSAKGNVEFKKVTLIYGENGKGKSTLATIFRSLSNNEVPSILAKKTIRSIEPQKINILFEGNNCVKFENDEWDSKKDEIIVFDENYINENVYSGNHVSSQNKQNLFYLVVGQDSVMKAIEIEKIDDEIRTIHKEINEQIGLINQHNKTNISIEDYLQLTEDLEIDCKIFDVDKEILSLNQSQEIKTKKLLDEIDFPDIDYDQLRALLLKTIESIDKEAIGKFIKLTRSLSIDEDWLHRGLDNIKDETCPFCKQSVNGIESIEIYKQYFNEELRGFKKSICDKKQEYSKYLSETEFIKIQSDLLSNLTLLEFWNNHFSERIELNDPSANIIATGRKLLNLSMDHIERKINSILTSTEFSDEFNRTIKEWESLKTLTHEYNSKVANINNNIIALKNGIGDTSIEEIKKFRLELENNKERFSESVRELIDNLQILQSRSDEYKQNKKELQQKLKSETELTLEEYKDQINYLLCDKFGLNFKIVKPRTSFLGRKTNTEYFLEINGEEIPLGTQETNDRPCFKTTLSSGEKSSLAFAFFIVQTLRTSNLEEKIIVIDDPVTSIDGDRKECVRDEIMGLINRAKQVVVLSYDPFFLDMIRKNVSKQELKTLCIVRQSSTSTIVEWNINDSIKSQYFNDCIKLQDYLHKGEQALDFHDVARAIRPVLEGNLRIRYPFAFNENQWLGDFIKIVKEDDSGDFSTLKPHLSELIELNDFSKKFHHDIDPSASQNLIQLTDTKLKSWVERTMNFLKVLG